MRYNGETAYDDAERYDTSISYGRARQYESAARYDGLAARPAQTWNAWGKSWGRSWGVAWGPVEVGGATRRYILRTKSHVRKSIMLFSRIV